MSIKIKITNPKNCPYSLESRIEKILTFKKSSKFYDEILVVPDDVTEIRGFLENNKVRELVIPKGCELSKSFRIQKNSVRKLTFKENKYINIPQFCAINSNITELILPNSLENIQIQDGAFQSSKLFSLRINSKKVYIGCSAFKCCNELFAVNFADSLEVDIDRYAFKNCNDLSIINFGYGKVILHDNSFDGTAPKEIYVRGHEITKTEARPYNLLKVLESVGMSFKNYHNQEFIKEYQLLKESQALE